MESQITTLFFLVVAILSVSPVFSATDSVSFNSTSDVAVLLNDGQTLVSEDGTFEVGFFSPNGSHRRYLGIWYRDYPSTVVWVANRKHGVPDKTGYLCFNVDGNLEILDGIRKSFWLGLEKLKIVSASYNLRISDSGNLILTWVEEQGILWQSFDDPTDTFLSGMKMVSGLYLTSWTSHDDPSPGNYMFQLDDQQTSENQQPEFIILNNSRPFWNTGGQVPLLIPELLTNSSTWSPYSSSSKSERSPYSSSYAATRSKHSSASSSARSPNSSWRRRWVSYSQSTKALTIPDSKFRILMGFDGRLRFYPSPNETKPAWVEPVDICDLQWPCGSFGSCNREHRLPCKCLPGFVPKTPENWDSGDFSEGCTRNSQDCRKKSTVFLNITVAGMEKETGKLPNLVNEDKCRNWCLENCNCQAYSFDVVNLECRYWSSDVKDIEETSSTISKVGSLMVRVQDSDIESTKKDCKPCGTDTIPYPLSTGPDCGDPRYSSFVCDAQNGRLSFTALNRTYMVTRIDKQSRKFFIQAGKENCNLTAIPLNQSLPFQIHKGRCNDDMGNVSFGPFHDGKSFFEMAIVWDSPPEPVCGSDDDCKTWPNSSCRVKVGSEKRCICDGSSRWDGTNVNCTQSTQSTQSVGVGLSALPSKILKTRWRLLYSIILGCVGGVVLISGFAFPIILYMRKTRRTVRNKGRNDDNLALRMYDSEKRVKEFINSGNEFGEDDKRDLNVPFFDLDCISAATDFFSIDNKLGQGGFGPVYKGKFPGGQEIAVKRLSTASAQGLEEFKNEAVLIAKLQHKNLVRLLGYCVEGNEKMLLYEYMPHKSLDFFIFDQSRCMLLDWDMRFNIIMGIARGLLYLHHDSRLTIIHRDLKTSNILLDEEMNPRISDFGMARIMGGKVTEANTVRVVGTYGYMSPEYAADGNFSIKSDVFSFGVVLLEIISGKKNTGFYKLNIKGMSLLGHVWRCWREENVMEVMDQSLSQTCVANEFLRCVNVALLCVQEDPNDRPTMANVLFMLGSEAASLGCPKEPAFTIRRDIMSSSSSSLVTMEITQVEAR